ncbi:hypothetical protein LT337_32045 (plasmid) [Mycolicibacterium fortuitum]|nr:hypothetical protein LT337_32045 [Mycolicibacterium fortuitum]
MMREFGPSPFITTALAVSTLSPSLLMLATRHLWPQTWVNVTIAVVAAVGVAITVLFFRRAVPNLNSGLWQLQDVRSVTSADSLLSLYVVPSAIALVSPSAARWAALAALFLLGFLAVRTTILLTSNPLLTLIGLRTYHAQAYRPAIADQGQPVTILARSTNPYSGGLVRLIHIGHGVHVQIAQDELADSSPPAGTP